jgi:K+-sensing histidine kinase KdpD
MALPQVRIPTAHLMSGLLASVAMVGVVTGVIALLEPLFPPLYLVTLYSLVVPPVAVVWGTGPAVAMAVLSVVVYTYRFVSSEDSLQIGDWRNAVGSGVFLATLVVVGELASRSRRAARESAWLTEEQSALRRVATLSRSRFRRRCSSRPSRAKSVCCVGRISRTWGASRRAGR